MLPFAAHHAVAWLSCTFAALFVIWIISRVLDLFSSAAAGESIAQTDAPCMIFEPCGKEGPRIHINSPIYFDAVTMSLIGQTYNPVFDETSLFMNGAPSATETVGTVDYNNSTMTDPVTGTYFADDPFIVHYSGQFNVTTADTYHFQLPNADGAILLIDGTPVIYAASLAGDANLDGVVDTFDQSRVLAAYYNAGGNHNWTDGDVTGEGAVDFFDLSEIYAYFYNTSATVSAGVVDANTNYMVDDGWLADGKYLGTGQHSFDLYYFQLNSTGSPSATLQFKGTTYNNTSFTTITGAPTVVGGPSINTTKGPAVYGTIATFAAAAHGTSASNYTVDLDWGDGSSHGTSTGGSPALTIHDLGNTQFSITGSHSYADADTYTLALTVTYNPTGDAATATGAANIAEDGPGLDLQFNSTNGGATATDVSGYGNTGTLSTGDTAPAWSGAVDGATGLFFSDANQRVSVPDAPTLDPTSKITLGAYVNAASWSSGRNILDKSDGTTTQYALWDDSGNLKFSLAGVGSITTSLPSTGVFHAIAGTYDGTYLKLFVDGSQAASTSASGSPTLTTGDLDIGDAPGSTSSADVFNGTIEEADVYDYAVGSSDIPGVFPAPTVDTAASASSSTITGSTVDLSVLGASPTLDESALTYAWAATSTPTGAPDPYFSADMSNDAKDTTATFFHAGSYTLEGQISDGVLTTTSSVSVTVNQTLSSIQLTPFTPSVAHSNTYHLAAVALDQFGNPMASQPSFTWAVTGGSGSGTVTSGGVYTAPSSGSGPYTVTASASGITGSAAISIGSTSSATSVPTAVADLIAIDGGDGSAQLAWSNGSGGGAIDGFNIEASTDGGTTYTPIGVAHAGVTSYLADSVVAGMDYLFRVTPFNAAGQGTSTATGAALNLDSETSEGWYKVGLLDSDGDAETTQDFLQGDAGTAPGGSLSLTSAAIASGGWVEANSAAAALRQAITGTFVSGYDSSSFAFPGSGALVYNPDFQYDDGTTTVDVGPAIVAEDEYNAAAHGDADYNDAYVPVSIIGDQIDVQATTDQNGAAPGYLNVATFTSPDPSATASDFSASVTWSDNSTTSGVVNSLADGSFMASVIPPSGIDPSTYTVHVSHSVTGTGGDGAMEEDMEETEDARASTSTPSAPAINSVAWVPAANHVALTWTQSNKKNITAYYIFRSIAGANSFTTIGTTLGGSNTSFNDPNAQPSTSYVYAVQAQNKGGKFSKTSKPSKAVAIPAAPTTAAPTELQVYTSGATSTNNTPTVSADSGNALPSSQVLTWKWAGSGTPTFQILRSLSPTTGFSALSGAPTLSGGIWHYTDTTAALPTALHIGDPSGIYYYKVTATISGVPSLPTPTTYAPQFYLKLGLGNTDGRQLADFFDKKTGCETRWYGADETTGFSGDTSDEEQALNAQLNADGTSSSAVLGGISFGGAESVGITYDTNDLGSHKVSFLALIDPVTPGSQASHPKGCQPNAHAFDVSGGNLSASPPVTALPVPGSNPPDPSSVFSPNTNVIGAKDWHQTYAEEYSYEHGHPVSGKYQGFATGTLSNPSQNALPVGDDHTSQVHVDDVWSTLKTQLTTLAGNGALNSDGTRSWVVA
jgi:hypothetical protein